MIWSSSTLDALDIFIEGLDPAVDKRLLIRLLDGDDDETFLEFLIAMDSIIDPYLLNAKI